MFIRSQLKTDSGRKFTKICKSCGISKSVDEFYVKDKFRGTRKERCKDCLLRLHADKKEQATI